MRTQNTKILYTYTARRSFVRNDLAVLEKALPGFNVFFQNRRKNIYPAQFSLPGVVYIAIRMEVSSLCNFFCRLSQRNPRFVFEVDRKEMYPLPGGNRLF